MDPMDTKTKLQSFTETAVPRLGDQAPAMGHHLQGPHPLGQQPAIGCEGQSRVRPHKHMLWPERQQLGIEMDPQAPKTDQYAPPRIAGEIQLAGQLTCLDPGLARRQAKLHPGNSPGHRHGEGAGQEQLSLAVEGKGLLAPMLKPRTHGAIDGFPAKAGQPNQGRAQALGQQRRRGWHITQHQDWLVLG